MSIVWAVLEVLEAQTLNARFHFLMCLAAAELAAAGGGGGGGGSAADAIVTT